MKNAEIASVLEQIARVLRDRDDDDEKSLAALHAELESTRAALASAYEAQGRTFWERVRMRTLIAQSIKAPDANSLLRHLEEVKAILQDPAGAVAWEPTQDSSPRAAPHARR